MPLPDLPDDATTSDKALHELAAAVETIVNGFAAVEKVTAALAARLHEHDDQLDRLVTVAAQHGGKIEKLEALDRTPGEVQA